jgi:hypothetical protein
MDLQTWLPGLFVLGLALMGMLSAFIYACDRV